MQKFYAHSNWVEMGNDDILDLIWDDFGNLASNKTDTCHEDDLTVDVLTSGYFHYNASYHVHDAMFQTFKNFYILLGNF